jgi:thiol:disulfide interchange protein
MVRSIWTFGVLAGLLVAPAGAQEFGFDPLSPARGKDIRVEAIPSHLQVAPGQTFHVALVVTVAPDWVYYSPDPGEMVKPGAVLVDAKLLTAGETLWPTDHVKLTDLGDRKIPNNVYTDRNVIYVPLTVPGTIAEREATATLTLDGQVCKEQCVDLEGIVASVAVKVAANAKVNPAWQGDATVAGGLADARTAAELTASHAAPKQEIVIGGIDTADLTVWGGLGVALLAGLILNIMPCVLPVIPLRVLSIVQMAGESRRRFVTLGLAFAGGMVVFFAGIAVFNIVLVLVFDSAFNWSQQWQLPGVRIGMAMALVAVAANLFGLFTVTVPRKIAAIEASSTGSAKGAHLGSAGMGLMMAVLATPCSFAFLLGALAWATTQPLAIGTLTFLCIGVGMAAPHAVLAAFPSLIKIIPKPGRWMELFRQAMGFPLLLIVVYLLSTLTEDAYPFRVAAWGVVLAFALWMFGSWVAYNASITRKVVVRAVAIGIAVGSGLYLLPQPAPLAVAFEAFDEARITVEPGEGKTVVVKFTATWCTSCLWIDATVYDDASLAETLDAREDIVLMKGDATNEGSPASRYLKRRYPGKAIPITVIYPPNGAPPVRLEGKYSTADLLEALDRATGA